MVDLAELVCFDIYLIAACRSMNSPGYVWVELGLKWTHHEETPLSVKLVTSEAQVYHSRRCTLSRLILEYCA